MVTRPSTLLLIVLLFTSTARATDIDWAKARTEAVQLLQQLIRIDTTNPPGNERAVALHLQKLLESDGIETRLLELLPAARISMRDSRRWYSSAFDPPQSHNVVMAEPQHWTVPPFSGGNSR